MTLYSFWALHPCFRFLDTSFFPFELSEDIYLFHTSFLQDMLNFQHDGTEQLFLRRLFLMIDQPLGPFALKESPQWNPNYWFLEQSEVSSPEILCLYSATCFPHFSQNLQPPSQSRWGQGSHIISLTVIYKQQIQQSTFPMWSVQHLHQKNWPQSTPETSWIACGVASCLSNMQVQVLHENQGPWSWCFLRLFKEGFVHYLVSTRRFVADVLVGVPSDCPHKLLAGPLPYR